LHVIPSYRFFLFSHEKLHKNRHWHWQV